MTDALCHWAHTTPKWCFTNCSACPSAWRRVVYIVPGPVHVLRRQLVTKGSSLRRQRASRHNKPHFNHVDIYLRPLGLSRDSRLVKTNVNLLNSNPRWSWPRRWPAWDIRKPVRLQRPLFTRVAAIFLAPFFSWITNRQSKENVCIIPSWSEFEGQSDLV